ncbi:MAG: hypothetical protein HY233_04280 [Acidobacteriales bacterium]|nr:hypothetical protein [Candidatus Koribacter versatilis]MBI3645162.1 hypothetical protein [Terriglobales bacterium]
MFSLRSVGVLSCAKMMGAVYGCLGLVFVPFFLLGGFAGMMMGSRGSGALSGIAMLFLAILFPLLYGAMGFLFGALTAWLYNLCAGWVGGVRLELKADVANFPSS